MEFNHFDSSYLEHQNGLNPTNPLETERSFNGYLSHYYNYREGVALDNKTVYDTIEEQIATFMNDYKQEFAPNTQIIPILSAKPLGELDINDPNNFVNFFNLVSRPNNNYFGNDGVGNPREYYNLLIHTFYLTPTVLSPFYIFYVSNPNIINNLIDLKLTTKEELIDYFTNNSVEFMPFSEVQSGKVPAGNLEKYTPEHVLTFQYPFGYFPPAPVREHFKFLELILFFANAPSIKNKIEVISKGQKTIDNLNLYLQFKIWGEISNFLLSHDYYFDLRYPDVNNPVQNWNDVTKRLGLYAYFEQYLLTTDLITIQYLDSNYQVLNLLPTDKIDRDKIKNINFNIGPDKVVTNRQLFIPQHSFSFFFKFRWL
ncbi:hypothetical protein [Spiroplasma sp. AdecLV25b]|uniref:hypothetical protein n=1 Tax=Spiroplasma sp. AdecLV25b TaxID=3027162 RepID=UPI0027E12458|nr:hypothetical protein [Spiroplasma sp. AdecLV25b]